MGAANLRAGEVASKLEEAAKHESNARKRGQALEKHKAKLQVSAQYCA